jgi:hypothetical protein
VLPVGFVYIPPCSSEVDNPIAISSNGRACDTSDLGARRNAPVATGKKLDLVARKEKDSVIRTSKIIKFTTSCKWEKKFRVMQTRRKFA